MFSSCTDEDFNENMTMEQRSLIGKAVNFNASIADAFTTRTTYEHNGVFNDDDIMVIYRQYYNTDTKSFDWSTEDFHTYYFRRKYASGSTNISLGREWQIAFSNLNSSGNPTDSYLYRLRGKYSSAGDGKRTLDKAYQFEKDSIVWENGKTLRYRAWSRSNNSNALRSGSKGSYYPDFEISDWVNVSGPTNDIPLTLRHIGSRIMFSHKNQGNQLSWAEICTDPKDYERLDNSDNTENDNADMTYPKTFIVNGESVTLNSAEEAAAAVKAVYDRMCMPAGVNIEEGTLRGMTKTAYENTTNFSKIEEWEFDETNKSNLVEFGEKSAKDIAEYVQRPVFSGSLNSRLHLITIPYDMSNAETSGEILTLPAWTRIKVWLYDVNGGDKGNTDNKRESEYHIFALDDLKKDGELVYPNGLEMRPGFSYEFTVGYRYNKFTITPGENISWVDQDNAIEGDAQKDIVETPAANKYSWWKNAIKDAIPRGNEPYYPEFHITNEEQFLEFIKLVNGEAGKTQAPIYRLVKEYTTITNTNGTITKVPKTYGWSTVNSEKNAVWVEKEQLEEQGYVFYEHYHPAEGDRAAYSVEDYLQGAYSFYDVGLSRPFTVYLDADLDFKDMKIDAVGTAANPFRGFFEGCPTKIVTLDASGEMTFTDTEDPRIAYTEYGEGITPVVHTIKNLNVNGGYLFGYVKDSAIRNLMLQGYHTIGLLHTATPSMDGDKVTGWGCNIVGISVKANNTLANHNAIAKSLTGLSYVVGCIHEGDATGALVGSADNMTMYGCMRTADNISGGALLGAYSTSDTYLAPNVKFNQYSTRPTWSRFMCNYYNKDIREDSKDANAIGNIADDYSVWYYIRGCASRILCAQNDNLLDKKVFLSQLASQPQQIKEFYGLAPWKAMNYAIYKYNSDANYPGKNGHECRVHYQVGTVGYDHTYPQLVNGKPDTESGKWNVLTQPN